MDFSKEAIVRKSPRVLYVSHTLAEDEDARSQGEGVEEVHVLGMISMPSTIYD